MLFLGDIKKIIEEAINPRLNSDESKSLDQIIGDLFASLVGRSPDSGGGVASGSVFGKLNKLLTDWTTTRAGYVDNIYSKVNGLNSAVNTINPHTTAQINSVKQFISAGSSPIIKSVQRGVTTSTSISISSVNPAKAFVVLNNSIIGYHDSSSSEYPLQGSILINVNSTSLKITKNILGNGQLYKDVSWQVIEFY